MLEIYNTLTKKKEIFKPMHEKKVNMFVCGPTVYDYSHIGHAKTYVQFDIIAKYLTYKKYKVFYLQNITDLDDKIINRARETKKTVKELAVKFEKEYYKDMKSLGIISVTKYARATDYIKPIIKQVKTLVNKGYGYKIDDGIYYDLSKFKEYGKLSGRTTLKAEDAVTRIDDSINKKNKGDFCLWKFSKPNEPMWNSPYGKGRPGWHIEDTAITEFHFGPQYDIHGGARDLIFPHHEAEIAQMEAASGKKPFVRYWMHTGFLTVDGKKMAKSLGNFVTVRDALRKYNAKTLRFFYLLTHYRSPIDFSEKNLKQTEKSLDRLNEFLSKVKKGKDNEKTLKLIKKTKKEFVKAMDNDFDTPKALAVIFNFVRNVNKVDGGKKVYNLMKEFDKIFGILTEEKEEKLPSNIKKLIEKRENYRKKKDWKKADKIREKLKKKSYILKDTDKGIRWKKVKS